MGGRIPEEVIDQIKQHFDIIDVVSEYVPLKKSGKNFFGLCPFHSEKSPSFSVSPDKQIFYCFGCGVGGNLIKFLMDIEQWTFRETIQHLADRAGITLPQVHVSPLDPKEKERQLIREALELATKWYHHILLSTPYGTEALQYLEKRQISRETISEFQIGFAPTKPFILPNMKKRGYSEQLLEKAGLVSVREGPFGKRYFDRFRGRIMFPIHDAQGRIIGFGGRLLSDGQPKYLNSPETLLFRKGNHLFNFHRSRSHIRKKQQCILFEGYIDVISAWQAGIRLGVATQGTSLTDDQARMIARNCETVIICYDSDTAGQSAVVRAIELFKQTDCTVKVAQMPPGYDPDDYIRQFGASAFQREVLSHALSSTAFLLEYAKKDYQLQDPDDRMKYIAKAIHIIADLPLAIEQDHYLKLLMEEFDISWDALREELYKAKKQKKFKKNMDKDKVKWNNGYLEVSKHLIGSQKESIVERAEFQLLAYMMKDEKVAEWVKRELGADFYTESCSALAAYLYAFYNEGHSADVNQFMSTLSEPILISLASRIAMMDLPEKVSEEALMDCVQHIQNAPILEEIERKEKMVEQLSRTDEPVKAAQLLQEIAELRKQLKLCDK